MFGIRKLKEKFSELKSLVEKTVLRSQSHDSVILGIKGQVDQLRNDMAAEFVKRDKDIDLHWGKIQNVGFEFDLFKVQEEAARHRFEGAVTEKNKNLKEDLADLQKLFQSWVGDLSGIDKRLKDLDKRLKDIEEYVGMQTDSIAAIILACGLRENKKFEKAYSQIRSERSKLHDIAAKGINGKVKESKFNGEMTTEPTLFPVEPEKPAADWVNGAEAAKMLGWQTCSSEKLLRARITFRQAAKNKPLSVNVKSVKDFIARRKPRRRETSGK